MWKALGMKSPSNLAGFGGDLGGEREGAAGHGRNREEGEEELGSGRGGALAPDLLPRDM